MRIISLCSAVLLGLSLASCMDAPPLEMATGDITVNEVVERVKCELAFAFADRIEHPKFRWMQNWTVKADMTLQANMQAGLTPSAGYTRNFPNAYNTAAGPTSLHGSTIGAIPQFFSLGASANAGEQAYRTETISFSLSLKELQLWLEDKRKHDPQFVNSCFPAKGSGMAGDLGLAEWVQLSLEPVNTGKLLAGYHPAPGTGSAAKPSAAAPGPKVAMETSQVCEGLDAKTLIGTTANFHTHEMEARRSQYYQSQFELENDRHALKLLQTAAENFRPVLIAQYRNDYDYSWRHFIGVMNQKLSDLDLTESIGKHLDALHNAACTVIADDPDQVKEHKCKAGARTAAGTITAQQAAIQCNIAKAASEKVDLYFNGNSSSPFKVGGGGDFGGETAISKALSQASTEIQNASKALPDPPIDALTHSVQFVISYGAGVTPSWTLAVWKGPGSAGSFASASAGRQHTLNIAAGPPDKADATRILNNLNIQQSFHQ